MRDSLMTSWNWLFTSHVLPLSGPPAESAAHSSSSRVIFQLSGCDSARGEGGRRKSSTVQCEHRARGVRASARRAR